MDALRCLLPLTIFILGIAVRLPAPAHSVRAALAGGCVLLAAGICLHRPRGRAGRAWAGICLGIALLLAGGLAADAERTRVDGPLAALPPRFSLSAGEDRIVRLSGRFAADPECVRGWLRAAVDADTLEDAGVVTSCPARILISWPAPEGPCGSLPLAGARMSASVRLRLPRSFGNPAAYDTARHLREQGAAALGVIKSARLLSVGAAPIPSPAVWARRRFDAVFRRCFAAPGGALTPEGRVIRVCILGGSTDMDAQLERALAASGVYHVLAISGLQIAVCGGSLLWALRRTGVPETAAVVLATGAVVLYGGIAAPSASVERAVLMGALAGVARVLHRRTSALQLLSTAGLTGLCCRPSESFDPGFHLTFAATAAILVFSGRLAAHLPARFGLSALLAASVSAQAVTVPIVAYWFHRMVPFGLVSNLVAVPLGSLTVILGILLLPADLLFPPLARAIAALTGLTAKAFLCVAEIPVEGTFASFRVAPPGPLPLAFAAMGWLILAAARSRRGLIWGGSLLAISFAAILIGPGSRFGHAGTITAEAIDVGQGDAILVGLPDGELVLVDGGGIAGSSFDIGARVVVPEIESRGIRRLSRVVLTHAHEDHGGGLREVLRDLRVGELLTPDAPEGNLRDELEVLARRQGTRVVRVRRGYRIQDGTALIECLAPFAGARDDPNADSIVLRIRAAGRCLLLTGDIGAAAERRLLRAGLGPCDVVKVAHHGSASSSADPFLQVVRPRVALISVGESNRFGHPSERVIERLGRVRAQTWRTDRDGAVRVMLAPDGVWAGSALPDKPLPFPGPRLRPGSGPRQ